MYNKEWLRRLAEGDEVAYRSFFDSWWTKMYANALRFSKAPEQAQDMAQEVFIKLWVNREKLATVESLENYLYFIARNVFLDYLKRKILPADNSLFLDTWFEDKGASIHRQLEGKELEQILLSAIEQLPPQMQTAFRLSRFEGLTHEQIADRMQISKTTSQSYIVRALIAIRKYLEDKQYPLTLFSVYLFLSIRNFS